MLYQDTPKGQIFNFLEAVFTYNLLSYIEDPSILFVFVII
jgi:hypothetical protein